MYRWSPQQLTSIDRIVVKLSATHVNSPRIVVLIPSVLRLKVVPFFLATEN